MKTIIKIFLSFAIAISPIFLINSANAATVGGWNLSNAVAQGASTVYDATKNVVINGKDFVKKSWVKITPTASQVSKVLARGGAAYALSFAVEQLLGSVDWVLDPDNNRIKYYPAGNFEYTSTYAGMDNTVRYTTLNQLCAAALAAAQKTYNGAKTYGVKNNACYIYYGSESAYDYVPYSTVEAEREEKYLPLDVVAQKVISNAEAGDSNAKVATTAAAADIVAEAETDQTKARPITSQAEANAETKPADSAEAEKANEATGTSQPNTANPEATDIALKFPVFCNWAPTICEAAQVVISFPQTLTGWYTDTKTKAEQWASSIADAYRNFMKNDELPAEDTKVDITDIPTPELQENAINWGSSCPGDVSIPISMQGVSSTLVFSWSPWCQLLSIIKPAIIASAYIGAAFIVLGLRT